MGYWWRRASVLLAIAALAASAGCTSASGSASVNPTGGGGSAGVQDLQASYEQVVTTALPSIVRIDTSAGLGSGVILDANGDVVTNAHVVGTATTFTVTLSTDRTPLDAKLVASFPQGDLAVIKLTNPPQGLKAATFADSSKLKIGQIVMAMGNPLGLSSSVTQGIVSATGRTVNEPGAGNAPPTTLTDMVQTSAAINPGNSGGALVDLSGQIVGIPTLTAVDQELGGAAPGIGFAISSNTARNIADQMVRSGKVTNSGLAALDVTVRTVADAKTANPIGVGVISVTPNGAAANAGIVAGDLITQVNGTATPTTSALSEALATLKPGQRVPVVVTHADGSESTVTVTLGTLAVG